MVVTEDTSLSSGGVGFYRSAVLESAAGGEPPIAAHSLVALRLLPPLVTEEGYHYVKPGGHISKLKLRNPCDSGKTVELKAGSLIGEAVAVDRNHPPPCISLFKRKKQKNVLEIRPSEVATEAGGKNASTSAPAKDSALTDEATELSVPTVHGKPCC